MNATRFLIWIPLIAIVAIAPTACHHGYYGGGYGFNPEERHERGVGHGYARGGYGHGGYRGEYYERRSYHRPYRSGYGWGFSGYYDHQEHGHRRHNDSGYRELSGPTRETKDRERFEESD